jgi:hypothetical protein
MVTDADFKQLKQAVVSLILDKAWRKSRERRIEEIPLKLRRLPLRNAFRLGLSL